MKINHVSMESNHGTKYLIVGHLDYQLGKGNRILT